MRRILVFWLLAATLLFARGGGGCFLPGTMVQTAHGDTAIESVRIGDQILSFDGDSILSSDVSEIYQVTRDHYYVIETSDDSVKATAEHPFYIGDGRFMEAQELSAGDTVYTLGNGSLLKETVLSATRVDEPTIAYNLRVDNAHTFFAGDFAVHNKGGCFLPGTEIYTPSGTRDIESLSTGDIVTSFSGDGLTTSKVLDRIEVQRDFYYVVSTSAGSVKATAEHPFYVGNGIYRETKDLKAGDTLFMESATGIIPQTITGIVRVDEPTIAYNLHVDGPNTFFANGFAVHNKGGCFQEGTQVSCPSGNMSVQDIVPGDTVYSFFHGSLLETSVRRAYSFQADGYYDIIAGNYEVNVTAEHPFYTGRGYVQAQDVGIGDTVYVADEASGLIEPAQVTGKTFVQTPLTVYNLETDGPHTFVADGFAVHNKGGGGSGGSSGPPDNMFFYSCNDLAVNKSDCCAVASASYKALPAASTPLSSYAPVGFGSTLNCQCQKGGAWQSTSTVNSSFTQCQCINNAGMNPVSVKKCFDWMSLFCPGLFVVVWLFFFLFGNKVKGSGFVSSDEWSSTISVPKDKVIDKAKKVSALLSTWGKVDPLWAEVRMKADAKATFLKLQECWSKRDYTEMKPLMQDDLYMQHVAQLEAMKGRHEINRMDDLKLLDLQLVLVNNMHDKSKDNFVVWVNASAKDTIVDDRTNNKIRGDVNAGVFEEFWTFERDGDSWKLKKIDQPEEGMDVITKENFDSISTQTGLELQYQKAGGPKIKDLGIVATRERDEGAVGSEMDKIKSKSGKVGRLLNFLADQDKIWDSEKMVGYVRSMFIAFNVALELKSLDQIRDNLTPEAVTQYQQMVDDLRTKNRKIEKRNLAVRNVEIVLVKNFYDNRKDSFTAWVSGQAQTVITDEKSGKVVEGDDHVADFEEYWTFRRDGDRWLLVSIESGFKDYVEEENVDEGSDKQLMEWYYTKDRAV